MTIFVLTMIIIPLSGNGQITKTNWHAYKSEAECEKYKSILDSNELVVVEDKIYKTKLECKKVKG